MKPDSTAVLVTGDIVVDRHLYEGARLVLQDQSPQGTRLIEEAGGAAITQRLIAEVFALDFNERRVLWERDKAKADQDGVQPFAVR